MIHNKGDTKQHMVWLYSIRTTGSRRADSSAGLYISGLSAGDREGYSRLSDFNKAIKETKDFSEDLLHVDPPTGGKTSFSDKKYPSVGWTFEFTLHEEAELARDAVGT